MENTRLGQFHVSMGLNVETLFAALEFVARSVEANEAAQQFLCMGVSPHFDEVSDKGFIPEYAVMFDPSVGPASLVTTRVTPTRAPATPRNPKLKA